jgi:hypothetical protein
MGQLKTNLSNRIQIRVPSLDGKQIGKEKKNHSTNLAIKLSPIEKKYTEKDHIADVARKLVQIADKYMLGIQSPAHEMPPAFIYNLHTSLEHTSDEWFTKNKQTAGARQILSGSHHYNLQALNSKKPFCLVQNIPINNLGDALGYDTSEIVLEATLMSDMALLYTLYKNSTITTKADIDELFHLYTAYLTSHGKDQPLFSQSNQGKIAASLVSTIKQSLTAVDVPIADTHSQLEQCLRNIVAGNFHFNKNYSRLVQSLSVFIEPHSLSGCKSANERAQSINGRVCVLDLLLLTPELERTKEQNDLIQAITECAQDGSEASVENLRKTLAIAFNESLLQGGATLISLVDQGSGAKAQVRGTGFDKLNPNMFEEDELTYYHQSQTNIMQAHLGLTEFIKRACSANVKEKTPEEIDTTEQARLLQQVGVYAGDPQATVDKLLPGEAIAFQLYDGIGDYTKTHEKRANKFTEDHQSLSSLGFPKANHPKFFRELFIKYCTSRELAQYAIGIPDTRSSNPSKATIEFADLFGKEGLELYQLALEEERFSKEYMNAVFDKAKKEYKGKLWAERPIVVVGGPSASGKTFAANKVVERSIEFLEKQGEAEGTNYVIAADGADSREVSQIRKLAIRLANRQGFTGVKDLTEQSEVLGDVKECILDAVLKTDTLGAVIPETFSKGITIETLHLKIAKAPKAKPIFSRVEGADLDEFRTVVGFMGSTRAWKTSGFEAAKVKPLDLNSTDDLCESKAYKASGFSAGQKFSLYAQRFFLKFAKKLISFLVTNDMILLKPNPLHVLAIGASQDKAQMWTPAHPNDEGAIKVSKKAYKAWLKSDEVITLGDFAKKFPSIIETYAEFKINKTKILLESLLLTEPVEIRPALQKALAAIPKDCSDRAQLHQALLTLELLEDESQHPAISKLHKHLTNRFTEVESIAAVKTGKTLDKVNQHKQKEWERSHTLQQDKLEVLIRHQESTKRLVTSAHAVTRVKFTNLNRSFSLLERRPAEKLSKKIHQLEEECTRLIKSFEQQKKIINDLLGELPDENDIELRGQRFGATLKTQRLYLISLLEQLEHNQKELLLPTQTLLQGDPNAPKDTFEHDGLLNAINNAKECRTDTQLHSIYELTHEDKPRATSPPAHSSAVSVTPTPSAKADITHNEPVFNKSNSLKDDEQRIYTVKTGGAAIGKFSKEQFKQGATQVNKETCDPVIQLIATEPPKPTDSIEYKIMYAFAMAIELVANMQTRPSADNQLTLRGVDTETVGFLFTALLLIGKLPGVSYGPEALRVRTIHFDPETQLGYFGGFKEGSYHNNYFKDNPITNMILDDLKTLFKNKEKHHQAQEVLTKELNRITSFFGHNLQQAGDIQRDLDRLTKPTS